MNDLQQYQIKQSCKLALPNGLQELMSDISREVLRSQPKDLYNFITEYLGALLEARDKLAIAAQICDEICHGSCQPELEDELRDIGLTDEEIILVGNIVQKYFEEEEQGEKVHDTLLNELSKKVNVDESVLEALIDAVMIAFRRHLVNNAVKYEISEDDNDDRATKAVKNTVIFHKKEMLKTVDSETEVESLKLAGMGRNEPRENIREEKEKVWTNERQGGKQIGVASESSMSIAGSYTTLPEHQPYVASEYCSSTSESSEKEEMDLTSPEETTELKCENKEIVWTNEEGENTEEKEKEVKTSTASLAGSDVNLPKQQPYVSTDCLVKETPEKEGMDLDYSMALVTDSKKTRYSEDKMRQESS